MNYFDAHSDILFDLAARRARGETGTFQKHHLPRLRKGGAEGAAFALWLAPDTPSPAAATREMMAAARAELSSCQEAVAVTRTAEALQAREEGKFYIFYSAEGLDAIGEDIERLGEYYAFGCRSAMLTWNGENALAAGAACANDRGLTDCGRRAIRKLESLGMLVDVSHLNERSFWNVLSAAQGPLLASHSNARALCDAPRNLTDEQLRAIRDTGGVVGLNAWHSFVDAVPERQTVGRLAEHAAHLIDVCGVEQVACGFDFCEFLPGDASEPRTLGLEDSGRAGAFFACLSDRGLRRDEIEKIARGNILRLLEKTLG